MEHKVGVIRKILRYIYDLVLSGMLLMAATLLVDKEYTAVKSLVVMAVLTLVSYIVREFVGRIWLQSLLHTAMAATACLIPGEITAKVMLVIITGRLFTETFLFITRDFKVGLLTEIPWPDMTIAFILTGFGYYVKDNRVINVVLISTVLMLIIYFIIVYTDGISSYLAKTRYVEGLPAINIIKTNTIIVAAIVILTFVIIILCIDLGMGDMVHTIVMFIARLMIILLAVALIILLAPLVMLLVATGAFPNLAGMGSAIDDQIRERNIIDRIIEVMATAVVIIFFSYVLFRFARYLMKLLMIRRIPKTDRIEFLGKAEQSDRVIKRKKSDADDSFVDSVVRRRYKRTVRKYRRYFVPEEYDTTGDIKKRILSESHDDISGITSRYENARYGKTGQDK